MTSSIGRPRVAVGGAQQHGRSERRRDRAAIRSRFSREISASRACAACRCGPATKPLPLLRGLVLGVLPQIAELPRPLGSPWGSSRVQLALERREPRPSNPPHQFRAFIREIQSHIGRSTSGMLGPTRNESRRKAPWTDRRDSSRRNVLCRALPIRRVRLETPLPIPHLLCSPGGRLIDDARARRASVIETRWSSRFRREARRDARADATVHPGRPPAGRRLRPGDGRTRRSVLRAGDGRAPHPASRRSPGERGRARPPSPGCRRR